MAAETALPLAPEARGLSTAVTELPYAVVSPYSKVTVVLAPLLLTEPFNVAPEAVTEEAAAVATVGMVT